MIAFSRRWLRRVIDYLVLPLAVLLLALVLALRLWILPNIDRWRAPIADSISQAAGQRVTFGQISANWQGWHPTLRLQAVQVWGKNQRPQLFLSDVQAELSWLTLLRGQLRLAALQVDDLALGVRRDAQGGLHVAGIALNQHKTDSGFGDWLLAQRKVRVTHATLIWHDEQRGAPDLVLTNVDVFLHNRGRQHDFRLTATPPPQLAQPLDVRGSFHGQAVANLKDWRGTLYARVDRADIKAWQPWLALPYALDQGYGGARVWLQFASKQLIAITTDVALRQVRVQANAALPVLQLADVSGRVLWKRFGRAQSFAVKQLSLRTADFLYVAPFDFSLRLDPASSQQAASGVLQASHAQLGQLAQLAAYVPLPAVERQRLLAYQPRGQLDNLTLSWRGAAAQPSDYEIKGRFVGLGWQAQGTLPGASGLTGNIDARRAGGTLALNSRAAGIALPTVLFEPNLAFDTLTAQLSWRQKGAGYLFKLSEATFANADLAGSAFGDYQSQPGTRGSLDLTARVSRANAASAYKYLPLVVKDHTYQWLHQALLAGQGSDARIRVQGNLAKFPFRDSRDGVFEVNAKVTNGVLHYLPDWPQIEGITADLHFIGARMEISSDVAHVGAANLRQVSAVIADLDSPDELLEVKGEARGALAELVDFANASPVAAKLDNLTAGLRTTGDSALRLDLKIPLRRSHHTTLAGDVRFIDNTLTPAHDMPVLEHVSGVLDFTDSGLSAQNIALRVLGGAASVSATTLPDATVSIQAQGQMSAAGLQPVLGAALGRHLRGNASWQAAIKLRHSQFNASFNSDLQGMALDLPPPFAKTAAQSVPLRVEKTLRGADESLIAVHYGQLASALLLQQDKQGVSHIERGTLRFGGEASLPDEPGIWVSGTLALSDLNHWRSEFANVGDGTGGPDLPTIAGINLSFNSLAIFGRRFEDINIQARNRDGTWRAAVSGQGVEGEMSWRPASLRAGEAHDLLSADFKTLIIPPPVAGAVASSQGSEGSGLPALKLSVTNLQMDKRKLGQLTVDATPMSSGLRFESIRLLHPDSTFTMQGTWQPTRNPQTQAKMHLEINDIGKFLGRFDQPGLVKRGQAVLDGDGDWNGTPVDITIPSLAGLFALKATRGQFLKVNPGLGKLLGIVSLQALPRRIGLDFRDVFSDGFAFDEISGTMKLSRGVVYSNDFQMQGPAAKVSMSGVVNINAETQQLHVTVQPKLSESVALASGLVGGPIVGLGVLAVQKLLKDPFGQAATFDYQIDGSWADPVVNKVSR
jgi:uncharacterized protein (TIGR02099 family)